MILTDTHTHLYANQFDEDRKEMISKCFEEDITRLFLGCSIELSIGDSSVIFYLYCNGLYNKVKWTLILGLSYYL